MFRSSITVADLLREGTRTLREADVASPGLDAEVLLRAALEFTRELLFDALPNPVRGPEIRSYREMIQQRVNGIPVAYIVGKRAFYGRDFTVDPRVLVPRPETEFIVEHSVAWLARLAHPRCRCVDVGTGSGVIAISIASETGNRHTVIASDVSFAAIDVARSNRDAHQAEVQFIAGSLLDWSCGTFDLIAANLPYLRPDQAHPGIEHEPAIALFTGDDGFALNRALLEQAAHSLNRPGMLIMELDPAQSTLALNIAREHFPEAEVRVVADLAQTDRYLIVECNENSGTTESPPGD